MSDISTELLEFIKSNYSDLNSKIDKLNDKFDSLDKKVDDLGRFKKRTLQVFGLVVSTITGLFALTWEHVRNYIANHWR